MAVSAVALPRLFSGACRLCCRLTMALLCPGLLGSPLLCPGRCALMGLLLSPGSCGCSAPSRCLAVLRCSCCLGLVRSPGLLRGGCPLATTGPLALCSVPPACWRCYALSGSLLLPALSCPLALPGLVLFRASCCTPFALRRFLRFCGVMPCPGLLRCPGSLRRLSCCVWVSCSARRSLLRVPPCSTRVSFAARSVGCPSLCGRPALPAVLRCAPFWFALGSGAVRALCVFLCCPAVRAPPLCAVLLCAPPRPLCAATLPLSLSGPSPLRCFALFGWPRLRCGRPLCFPAPAWPSGRLAVLRPGPIALCCRLVLRCL